MKSIIVHILYSKIDKLLSMRFHFIEIQERVALCYKKNMKVDFFFFLHGMEVSS